MKLIGLALSAAMALAPAQTDRAGLAVASIKPSGANCCPAYGVGNGKGGGKYVTLKMLIGLAYQVQPFQISGGPGWMASDRFDVEGKADDPKADLAQLRRMLQSLLEDRFQLKIHRETRVSSIYALVVSKSGPKIKLSVDQTSPDETAPPASRGNRPNHGGVLLGTGMLVANALPMSRFALVISPQLDRMAVDKTNLPGRYDVELRWTPDRREPGGDSGFDAPSIFTAVQEQLGLKLEPSRGPVETLVVDGAQRPSAN